MPWKLVVEATRSTVWRIESTTSWLACFSSSLMPALLAVLVTRLCSSLSMLEISAMPESAMFAT